MPHFITTHSINNPNYIKMQQNKNQQLDAKFRKFIKVLIMDFINKKMLAPSLDKIVRQLQQAMIGKIEIFPATDSCPNSFRQI